MSVVNGNTDVSHNDCDGTELSNFTNETFNKNAVSIENIRKKFLAHYKSNRQLYDDSDIIKLKSVDWCVERFLISNGGNEDAALKNICEALKWRKSYGVNERSDDYFPDDFYKLGALFQYNHDKDGNLLIYFRVCVHHKVPELVKYVRQFFVHHINKIDEESGCGGKWAMVFDSGNSGISNVDLDMSRFMIHVLPNYFPKGYKYVLIYEMPWILVTFWKITCNWLSQDLKNLIKFAKNDQIFDYIDPEYVPSYINGGKCTKSINSVPIGVKPAEELPHLQFTKQQIERFRVIFKLPSPDSSVHIKEVTPNDHEIENGIVDNDHVNDHVNDDVNDKIESKDNT